MFGGGIGRSSISPGRIEEITMTISGPNDLSTSDNPVGPPPQSSVGPPPCRDSRTARTPWGRPAGSIRAAGGGGWAAGGGLQQRQPLTPTRTREEHEDDRQEDDRHPTRFCALAFAGCVAGFTVEIWQNGWEFQPFWCGTCDDGAQAGGACNEDGTPCEANVLLGPAHAAMVRSGGKLDRLIFEQGEWWRVLSCNWLHGGLLHLAMNMLALRNLGAASRLRVPLERSFGSWRIGSLYVLSGIFGTMVSVVFLPEVLSVGASASVFGLVGACWADVILNFCARGTLRGANACSLLLSTLINVCIGLTPFVDNFMHMGGLLAGLVIGGMLFSKKHPDAHGVLRYRESQRNLIFLSAVLFAVLCILTLAFAASPDTQQLFRSCSLCRLIDCAEPTFITGSPWWDCDLATISAGYACTLHRAEDDVMLCFCTDAPSCDGLNVSGAYVGTCALGDGACSRDDAAWCRDDFCQ